MTKRSGPTRSWGARIAVALGATMVLVGLLSPVAGANYARIEARVGCDRVVVWRASASPEGDTADRTNERVRVEYRELGGEEWRLAAPEDSFGAANDYSFGGEFDLPDGADGVEMRVTPLQGWGPGGSGDPAGAPRFATVELDPDCGSVPVVASVRTDCARGAATVELTSRTGSEQVTEVAADGVVLRSVVVGAESRTVEVPLLPGAVTPVSVRVGGETVESVDAGGECSARPGSAVVLEQCAPDDATPDRAVVLAVGGAEESTVEVRLSGTMVQRATLEADGDLRRVIDLPETEEVVRVVVDDTTVSAGPVGSCTGAVLGALPCGDGWPTTCDEAAAATTVEPPPPPPPPLVLDLEASELPLTGPSGWSIGLAAAGVLVALGGAAILAAERRRPVPSVLGPAVEAYRRPWWDDDPSGPRARR